MTALRDIAINRDVVVNRGMATNRDVVVKRDSMLEYLPPLVQGVSVGFVILHTLGLLDCT